MKKIIIYFVLIKQSPIVHTNVKKLFNHRERKEVTRVIVLQMVTAFIVNNNDNNINSEFLITIIT